MVSGKVESKINKILKDEPRMLGYCHKYWQTKKKILFEDYGIIWYTPAERHPEIIYD